MFDVIKVFFLEHVVALFGAINEPVIVILMTVEASFIPFPSEVVLIPAGMNIANNVLGFWSALGAAILGSLLGSLINYAVGYYIGRPFITCYGRYFFIQWKHYEKAERLFLKNALLYTFFGRLIPAVRQLISIPAGIFRMPLHHFLLATMLGSGVWSAFLLLSGIALVKGVGFLEVLW